MNSVVTSSSLDASDDSVSTVEENAINICEQMIVRYPFMANCNFVKGEDITTLPISLWKSYADTDEKICKVMEAVVHVILIASDVYNKTTDDNFDFSNDNETFRQEYDEVISFIRKHIEEYRKAIALSKQDPIPCETFVHSESYDDSMVDICMGCGQFEQFHPVCRTYVKNTSEENKKKDYMQRDRCVSCGLGKYKHKKCNSFKYCRSVGDSNEIRIFSRSDDSCTSCGYDRLTHTSDLKDKGIFACGSFSSDNRGGCYNCIFNISDHVSAQRQPRSFHDNISALESSVKSSVNMDKYKKELEGLKMILFTNNEVILDKDACELDKLLAKRFFSYTLKKIRDLEGLLCEEKEKFHSKHSSDDLRIMSEYKRLVSVDDSK